MGNYLCGMRHHPAFAESGANSLEGQYQQVHHMAWHDRIIIRGIEILQFQSLNMGGSDNDPWPHNAFRSVEEVTELSLPLGCSPYLFLC